MVYIEQIPNPIIASREHTIVESMVQTPKEVLEATMTIELLQVYMMILVSWPDA